MSDELVLAAGCASCISHSLPHTVQRPRVGRARIEIRLKAGEGGTTPYTATLLQIVSRVLEPTKATAGRLAPLPATGLASDFWARLIPLFEKSEQELNIQLEPPCPFADRVKKDLTMLST